MQKGVSRRDFLKLGGLSLAGLAFRGFSPEITGFEDADVVRVATDSWSVYSAPSLDSTISSTWYRDDLIHIYKSVTAAADAGARQARTGKPNPVWYRVWGGYMWRARLQRIKTIYNTPLSTIPQAAIPGDRGVLAEVTVPWTNPWRYSRAYGWEQLEWRLYYESVHWVDAVDEGPPDIGWYKGAWYRIWDHIASFPYFVPATHLRPILPEAYSAISPEVPWDKKRIDVNLTTQTLAAHEFDEIVFKTTIASGVPTSDTTTHVGKFQITEKLPTEHMGEANIYQAWTTTCWQACRGRAISRGWPGVPRHILARELWFTNEPRVHQHASQRGPVALPLGDARAQRELLHDQTGRGTAVDVHF
jgi:hypothetical protein